MYYLLFIFYSQKNSVSCLRQLRKLWRNILWSIAPCVLSQSILVLCDPSQMNCKIQLFLTPRMFSRISGKRTSQLQWGFCLLWQERWGSKWRYWWSSDWRVVEDINIPADANINDLLYPRSRLDGLHLSKWQCGTDNGARSHNLPLNHSLPTNSISGCSRSSITTSGRKMVRRSRNEVKHT